MIQINQQIITLFYALYNKGVSATVSLAKLCLGDIYSQKASALLSMLKKENDERKIAKYLVVPNVSFYRFHRKKVVPSYQCLR